MKTLKIKEITHTRLSQFKIILNEKTLSETIDELMRYYEWEHMIPLGVSHEKD